MTSERERNRHIWQARVLNWPWAVQELQIAKPRGISRFRSWAEQKCVDRLLFSYHNEERRKGHIYRAANGAAEYRSHQDHCIVRSRDLEARDPCRLGPGRRGRRTTITGSVLGPSAAASMTHLWGSRLGELAFDNLHWWIAEYSRCQGLRGFEFGIWFGIGLPGFQIRDIYALASVCKLCLHGIEWLFACRDKLVCMSVYDSRDLVWM